jgi:cell division protein FtsB
VLVLVLAVLMVSYASSMRAYLQQRDQINALRHDISTSRAQIAELQRQKRRFHDPAYVRAQARQRLGFAQPGEVELQVVGPDGKPLGHADSLAGPAVGQGAKQPQWYQAAWGSVVAAGTPKIKKHAPTPATKIRAPKSHRH